MRILGSMLIGAVLGLVALAVGLALYAGTLHSRGLSWEQAWATTRLGLSGAATVMPIAGAVFCALLQLRPRS